MRGWFFAGLLAVLPACGLITADRPAVQQGNVLTADDLASLERGLSRARVRERIGSPVLRDEMHPDRWDYVYYRTQGGMEVGNPQRLTLFFEGDRLVRIDNRYQPPDPEPLDPDAGPPPDRQRPSAPDQGPPQPNIPTPGPNRP